MYFKKFPFIENFSFATGFDPQNGFLFPSGFRPAHITSNNACGIFRITVSGTDWEQNLSHAELSTEAVPPEVPSYALEIGNQGTVCLTDHQGNMLLESRPGRCFGKCGQESMFAFQYSESNRYYGAGSKLLGMELSGKQTKFWNTDAFADFAGPEVHDGQPDPYYISIPYLIIKTPNGWVGLLYNNPFATFVSIGCQMDIEGFADVDSEASRLVLMGSQAGQPDLFILAAPSLAELTRKFQKLSGVTPLPPLWALGYQQSRWGYQGIEQLEALREKFHEHTIPVDGLWLDIGFMDEKKVFTCRDVLLPDPKKNFTDMLESGHPVVPIIDPGVKKLEGYPVYDDGKANDVFCKNPEGLDFVGLVWPGATVFPDFSRGEVRKWWAERTKAFAEQGIIGAWLDMNDPSVGPVNPYDMLFGKDGEMPHESYHNQYAFGMAQATRKGFEAAHPEHRIFLLTRSSFLSGQRYAAVWTGDNLSNYHYLKMGIANSLNLALSGMPFNGGDIGGFGDDTTPRLLQDWIKSSCLMPFCRNHCAISAIEQEPWQFDKLTLDVNRDFIRLRYQLMPYLYNLFVQQEETGEAIWRPLFYDFPECTEPQIDRTEDAFMAGPAILQAPFVEETEQRDIPLPGPARWFDISTAQWIDGGQTLKNVSRQERTSPLFLRERQIIPLRPGVPTDNKTDLCMIDLLIVADSKTKMDTVYEYVADDGWSKKYQSGERTRIVVHAKAADGKLSVNVRSKQAGYKPVQFRIVTLDDLQTELNGAPLTLSQETLSLPGVPLPVRISNRIVCE